MQQAKLYQFGVQGIKRPKLGSASRMDEDQGEDSNSDDDSDDADDADGETSTTQAGQQSSV